MSEYAVTELVIERLAEYLDYLKAMPEPRPEMISSTAIAAALKMGNVQVRKDIACVTNGGRPKVGYKLTDLISELEEYLGYNKSQKAVIVGTGKIGGALLNYEGFSGYGVDILAGFDKAPCQDGKNKKVYPMEDFRRFCNSNDVHIGIIAVPAPQAKEVCDMMIDSGITAIWNFAPIYLEVPENITVKNENMANSLVVLLNSMPNSHKGE